MTSGSSPVSPAAHQDYYSKRPAPEDEFSWGELAKRSKTESNPYIVTNLRTAQARIIDEYPQLSEKALDKIYSCVEDILEYSPVLNRSYYFRPEHTSLDRAFHINQDGRVFVHFNRSKEGDPILETGTYTLKSCIDLYTGEHFPSAGSKRETQKDDLIPYSYFQDVFGFVQIIDAVSYPYKDYQLKEFLSEKAIELFRNVNKVYPKYRVVFSYCNSGTLHNAVHDPIDEISLSAEDRKNVFTSLIDRIDYMHTRDLIHRDLTLKTILLHRDDNGILHPIIGNLDWVCDIDDIESIDNLMTTPLIIPPELVPAALFFRCLPDAKSSSESLFSSSAEHSSLLSPLGFPLSSASQSPTESPAQSPSDFPISNYLLPTVANLAERDVSRDSDSSSRGFDEDDERRIEITDYTTKALDIWGLGCALYQLTMKDRLPWMKGEQITAIKALDNIDDITKEENWFPEPKEINSPLHLVWEILKNDPKDRPTIQTIKSRLKDINWSDF